MRRATIDFYSTLLATRKKLLVGQSSCTTDAKTICTFCNPSTINRRCGRKSSWARVESTLHWERKAHPRSHLTSYITLPTRAGLREV